MKRNWEFDERIEHFFPTTREQELLGNKSGQTRLSLGDGTRGQLLSRVME